MSDGLGRGGVEPDGVIDLVERHGPVPADKAGSLMRRKAAQAGLRLSVGELLGQLAGIGETVLIYPSAGGRPKARRMTTELTGHQHELYEIFELQRWSPRT